MFSDVIAEFDSGLIEIFLFVSAVEGFLDVNNSQLKNLLSL